MSTTHDVIRCRRIEVVDDDGRVRIVLGRQVTDEEDPGSYGITLVAPDENGHDLADRFRAHLVADATGASLTLDAPCETEATVGMGASDHGSAFYWRGLGIDMDRVPGAPSDDRRAAPPGDGMTGRAPCPCFVLKDDEYVVEAHDRIIRALEDPDQLALLDLVATIVMGEGPLEWADIAQFGTEHAWSHPAEVGPVIGRLDDIGRAMSRRT